MNNHPLRRFLMGALMIGLGLILASPVTAQTFTNLHNFKAGVKTDGFEPYASLIISGNTLYGTTFGGGSNNGTVFAVKTDGTGYTNLYNFGGVGNGPLAGLILAGNTLYGTTFGGGATGNGTVFRINTDGSAYTNLHSFSLGSADNGSGPYGPVILWGRSLYGTTEGGGRFSSGTVFKLNTDGTGYTNVYSFTAPSIFSTNIDGATPTAGLLWSDGTLYGTAEQGGFFTGGAVFGLMMPRVTIVSSQTNVVLTWPTNALGFTLQSAPGLLSEAVWTTVSPGPAVISGQNVVTNPMSGPQEFYRLY